MNVKIIYLSMFLLEILLFKFYKFLRIFKVIEKLLYSYILNVVSLKVLKIYNDEFIFDLGCFWCSL